MVWPELLAETSHWLWVEMFSSIDMLSALCGRQMMEKREHKSLTSLLVHSVMHPVNERSLAAFVLLKSGSFIQLLWLTVSSLIKAALQPAVRLIQISAQPSRHKHRPGFFMPVDGTHGTPIWLAPVERTMATTSPLIGPRLGWRAEMWPSFMPGHGEKRGGTEGVWCWKSLYQSLTYLCTYEPWNYISRPKWRAHKDNLTMFLLHFTPELTSILSSLLGAGWLWCPFSVIYSASNHRPALRCRRPCSRSPDLHRARCCLYFLLFVVRLPADSRQTQPDGVWGVSPSARLPAAVQRTWIRCKNLIFYPTKEAFCLIPCSSFQQLGGTDKEKWSNLL